MPSRSDPLGQHEAGAVNAEEMLEALAAMPINPGQPVVFVETDWMSATWLRVKKHCEREIALLHVKLENAALGDVKTAVIRGQIKQLRSLLRLNESAPAQPVDDA